MKDHSKWQVWWPRRPPIQGFSSHFLDRTDSACIDLENGLILALVRTGPPVGSRHHRRFGELAGWALVESTTKVPQDSIGLPSVVEQTGSLRIKHQRQPRVQSGSLSNTRGKGHEHQIQHTHYGRILWFATGDQTRSRRTFRKNGLPAG